MELKGRIIKAGPIETRQRKNDGTNYTAFDLHIQIGTYERETADYRTHSFTKTTEADTIAKTYFHDDARSASEMFKVGDVVDVRFHHYVDQYGRTATVLDGIQHAAGATQAPQPSPAAGAPSQDSVLPF